jgi:Flagellar transcriptional activator (FlhC)
MSSTNETPLRLASKQTDILGLGLKLALAKEIIENGGRTSIVRAICGISKSSAIQLHREICGSNPTAGMLPSDEEWLVKTPKNCLHASVFFNIFAKISACSMASKAEAYVTAYRLYKQAQLLSGTEVLLDINRAWHIVQHISIGIVIGIACQRCRIVHVALKSYPKSYQFCPVCDSVTDVSGRLKFRPMNLARNSATNRP